MKIIITTVLILAIMLSLVGCGSYETYGHAEFLIELPDEYEQFDSDGQFDLALTDGTAVVGLNRISRAAAAEDVVPDWLSPTEFAEYYMYKSEVESEVIRVGDVPYYVYYSTPIGSSRQFCLAAFYRSQYAYFTLFCFVPAEAEGAYITDFIDYIDNVTFKSAD